MAEPRRQSPLKVDPAIDELISQGAHFLGLTKKDLVAEAVKDYLAARRTEIHDRMTEAMRLLDGSTSSRLTLLTGVPPEEIDRLGGVRE
ncbi:hypothetical protein [Plantactinospora endophytica]|uniref:Uncharacterized protein n=1 Tax=Plantactinospora endophytica TaxID=673535 RepID=A0ABQ4E419_9ACTN|nr:hypothetical protein [Plantactinospora endophytica]GIG89452.1 hypothetical protein Pen02_43880 [Plantactinospora endophytica]